MFQLLKMCGQSLHIFVLLVVLLEVLPEPAGLLPYPDTPDPKQDSNDFLQVVSVPGSLRCMLCRLLNGGRGRSSRHN